MVRFPSQAAAAAAAAGLRLLNPQHNHLSKRSILTMTCLLSRRSVTRSILLDEVSDLSSECSKIVILLQIGSKPKAAEPAEELEELEEDDPDVMKEADADVSPPQENAADNNKEPSDAVDSISSSLLVVFSTNTDALLALLVA